ESGCRGWNCTSIRAFKGRCPTIRRPGRRKRQKHKCRMTYSAKRRSVAAFYFHLSSFKLVEPEVVATSPYRIKSPVPVCCGFDSLKLVGERGLAPPRLTDSRSVGSAVPA